MFYKGFRHLVLSQQQLTFQNKTGKQCFTTLHLLLVSDCCSTPKATISLFGLMVFNDGFQQKRESKQKALSWEFYRKLY